MSCFCHSPLYMAHFIKTTLQEIILQKLMSRRGEMRLTQGSQGVWWMLATRSKYCLNNLSAFIICYSSEFKGNKKKKKEEVYGLCFAGLELFKIKNNIDKKPSWRYHPGIIWCAAKPTLPIFGDPQIWFSPMHLIFILQLSKSKWAIRIGKSLQVQAGICTREICWLENTFSHWEQCDVMYFQDVKIEILAAECQMQFCKNRLKWNEVFL